MTVLVWLVEGSWPACVAAARAQVRPGEDVVLLYVVADDLAGVAHGAFGGLLGRGRRPDRDPGEAVRRLAEAAAHDLLDDALAALGQPAATLIRHGRVEREVLAAAEDARLLVLARDTPRDASHPHPPAPPPDHVPPPSPGPPHPAGPPHQPGDVPGAGVHGSGPAHPPGPPAGRFRGGPHSLGPRARFVVDHAPCAVLLVWPG